MKRLIVFFKCLLLCLLLSSGSAVCFAEQENTEDIVVCGEAIVLSDREAAIARAVVDGQQRAVSTAIGRVLSPEMAVSSMFGSIVNNASAYCLSVERLAIREQNGEIVVFSRVKVDFAKVLATMQQLVKRQQAKNNGQQLFLFVRTIGFADNTEQYREQVKTLRIYNQTLQNAGFNVGSGDFVTGFMLQHERASTDDYVLAAARVAGERVEIGMAVIGEVVISTLAEDANGCTADAAVRLKIIDYINNQSVGEINQHYRIRRSTRSEAEQFAVNKAAHASVKQIETLILNYWLK